MNPVLTRVATALGALAFIVSMVIGCANGVAMTIVLFRATIVMIVTTASVALFLRYFTNMLMAFVAQRLMENKKKKIAAAAAHRETAL